MNDSAQTLLLSRRGCLSENEAFRGHALELAYIGDTVWDLLIRTDLYLDGLNLRHMHDQAVRQVNAGAQAEAMALIRPLLTEQEKQVALKGRNAHPRHSAPHHQSPVAYAEATGLETLLGYLYLSGQTARILELFQACKEELTCPKPR